VFQAGRLRGIWWRSALTSFALLVVSFTVSSRAVAVPKPSVEQVRKQVQQLNEQVEVASERYNDLREQITSLGVRLAAARSKLVEEQKAIVVARAELGEVAVDTYKAGDFATLALFFSDQPDRYLGASGLLMSLGDRKADAVDDVLQRQQQLVAAMTDIQEQEQRLEKARKDLQATRVEVERKLDEQTSLLARLTTEERERLGRVQSGQERVSLEDLGIEVPANGSLNCDDVPVVPPDARVAKVLAYACAQLGDPYQWAGSGPNTFDCSGLTMMAWKQAGVSLPHSSQMQATYGTKVSSENLRPGDLVFFHSGLTHVGIYIGKGLMLHAPQTGDVVKIAPMRYNGSFATAVRL
jgi:cell wall-associated NlpC family hydrolase